MQRHRILRHQTVQSPVQVSCLLLLYRISEWPIHYSSFFFSTNRKKGANPHMHLGIPTLFKAIPTERREDGSKYSTSNQIALSVPATSLIFSSLSGFEFWIKKKQITRLRGKEAAPPSSALWAWLLRAGHRSSFSIPSRKSHMLNTCKGLIARVNTKRV